MFLFKNVSITSGTGRIWVLIEGTFGALLNGNVYYDSVPGGGGSPTLTNWGSGGGTHADLASAQAAGMDVDALIIDPENKLAKNYIHRLKTNKTKVEIQV